MVELIVSREDISEEAEWIGHFTFAAFDDERRDRGEEELGLGEGNEVGGDFIQIEVEGSSKTHGARDDGEEVGEERNGKVIGGWMIDREMDRDGSGE